MMPLNRIKVYLEQLKNEKVPIRVHGNGFVQIQVNEDSRIHVWSPLITKQVVYTGIHDHRADFVSSVWYGVIYNRWYTPNIIEKHKRPADALYKVYEAVPTNRGLQDENTLLVSTNSWVIGGMNPVTETYQLGTSYFMPRYDFHETIVKRLAITNIFKFNSDKVHIPRVLVKVEEQSSNEFDRQGTSEDQLWSSVLGVVSEEIKRTNSPLTYRK